MQSASYVELFFPRGPTMKLSWLVVASLAVFGCSGTKDAPAGPGGDTDTGTVEDTAPAVDAAPWLTYPEGPYGVDAKGQVFPHLKFEGYLGGEGGEWKTIDMMDYYDPTGERGIFGVLVVVGAKWCGPCNEEAKSLPKFFTDMYKGRGAKFLSLLIQDSTTTTPASQKTADWWNGKYHLNFDLGIDPEQTSMPKAGAGIPRNYIINPRNMQIVRINSGVDPTYVGIPGLKPLLDYNGAPALPSP